MVIRLIFGSVFVIIVLQLINLQIFSTKYKLAADNNAFYRKVIYPDRGIIFDRKKKAILENTISYDLVVTPSEAKGTDTLGLCQLLGIDTAEFKKRMREVIFKNSYVRPSVFEALLSPELYYKLSENMYRFPGFVLNERSIRSYPYRTAAHVLGYIGEVDTNFLKKHKDEGYEMGDYAGLAGLERTYETVLMGQRGIKRFIRDNKGRIQGSWENGLFDTAAIAGRNLYTAMDVEIQQMAEKMLTNKIGSAVAINPKTGGIIAMASGPSYDPNLLTGSTRRRNFSRMFLDTAKPLYNRAIKGQYPPGSTFKPMGAIIALDEGIIGPSFGVGCGGAYFGCGSVRVGCTHKNAGHASNLRDALANSCNSYFSHIYRMSIDNPRLQGKHAGYLKWKEYVNSFGLGVKLGIDLPSEDRGSIPDTGRYNRDFGNDRWGSCFNLTLGIGQDRMTATPLQLANMMCVIANKGYFYTPHLVDSIESETAEDKAMMQKYRNKHEVTHIPDTTFQIIHRAMQDVTERGTATNARIEGINMCAKTGTAQNPHGKDHSIFVAFAPRENPQIAVAVVVENAGFGSTWAAPIASLMIEKYLRDTLSQRRLAEVDRISNADLLPVAIKRWYQRKDSIRLAKQQAAIDESAQIESKQEDRKVTYDPETGTRTDGPAKDSAKPKQQTPMLRPDDKKNAIKKATTNTRR